MIAIRICIVQSDCLLSKHVMGACFQFVHVRKRTFSSTILSLDYFPLEFFILPKTKGADDPNGTERKLNEIGADQSGTQTS